MQRMRRPPGDVDRAAGRDQRLADDLPAEHPLPTDLRRASAKKVQLELLEREDVQQILYRGGHGSSFDRRIQRLRTQTAPLDARIRVS